MSLYASNRVGGGSGGSGATTYPNFAAFPATAADGALAIALDTHILYEYNLALTTWQPIASNTAYLDALGGATSIGALDSQAANANGLALVANVLSTQSADATHPGMVNNTTQTFSGNKTFTGTIGASNFSGSSSGTNTGDVTLGTANGLSLTGQALSLGLSSTSTTGALSSTDWNTFNNKQSALTLGNLTDVGTDGIVITGGTGAVIGTGTSISQHVADATHNGYLSSTDWSTFNGKQAAGNYITALTGDATASGPGSAALTLATVNSNVGSFGSASSVAGFTVNGKGLITAASSTSIQIAESQVTNLVSDLAGKQPTGNYITALSGDVVAAGPGSASSTIQPNVVSNSKLAQMATLTIKGNNTGGTANASDLTVAQVNAILPVFTSSLNGLVPASGGGTTNFLRADGTFAAPPTNTGTVTTVSVVSANGLAGTVANPTTTPALTLSTTITGILQGNGTAISAASTTGSGNVVLATAPTLSLPVANNVVEGFSTTATAAGTTTLTVSSNYQQYFTGTTTQTVVLPTTSVAQGQSFNIVNLSTGVVTVQSSNGNTVQAMAANTTVIVTALIATPTTSANWNALYTQNTSVSQFNVPVTTAWSSYTPTITGVGTPTNVNFQYRQVGDSYQVQGTFTTGTNTAVLASMTLPLGASLATQTITNTTSNPGPQIGMYSNNPTGQVGGVLTATGTSSSVVYFSNPWPGTQPILVAANASSIWTSSTVVSIQFTAQISGLASNTTVALGQAPATNQTANTVYAGPSSGSAASPTFRSLVAADIPAPCSVIANNPTSSVTNSFTDVTNWTTAEDPQSAFNATTGVFTAPRAGLYFYSISLQCTFSGATVNQNYQIKSVGGTVGGGTVNTRLAAGLTAAFNTLTGTVRLAANGTFKFQISSDPSSSAFAGGGTNNFMSIVEIL